MVIFAVEVLHVWPGLAGLFVSGVLSASLSSISSATNSLSAVVLQDFVKALWPNWLSAEGESCFVKLLALAFGLVVMILAFLISIVDGPIMQLTLTATGTVGGPLFGVFTLGILFPWPTGRSALFGLLFSAVVTLFVTAGGQLSGIKEATPIRGIAECLLDGENASDFLSSLGVSEEMAQESIDGVFPLFRLSYVLLTAFGTTLCIVSTLIYAALSKDGWRCASLADRRLHYPLFYKLAFFLPENYRKVLKFGIDYSVIGEPPVRQGDMRHEVDTSGTTSKLLRVDSDDVMEMDGYHRSVD